MHVWIPVSGFKQQRKVSFDKWCCLNPEECGILILIVLILIVISDQSNVVCCCYSSSKLS